MELKLSLFENKRLLFLFCAFEIHRKVEAPDKIHILSTIFQFTFSHEQRLFFFFQTTNTYMYMYVHIYICR